MDNVDATFGDGAAVLAATKAPAVIATSTSETALDLDTNGATTNTNTRIRGMEPTATGNLQHHREEPPGRRIALREDYIDTAVAAARMQPAFVQAEALVDTNVAVVAMASGTSSSRPVDDDERQSSKRATTTVDSSPVLLPLTALLRSEATEALPNNNVPLACYLLPQGDVVNCKNTNQSHSILAKAKAEQKHVPKTGSVPEASPLSRSPSTLLAAALSMEPAQHWAMDGIETDQAALTAPAAVTDDTGFYKQAQGVGAISNQRENDETGSLDFAAAWAPPTTVSLDLSALSFTEIPDPILHGNTVDRPATMGTTVGQTTVVPTALAPKGFWAWWKRNLILCLILVATLTLVVSVVVLSEVSVSRSDPPAAPASAPVVGTDVTETYLTNQIVQYINKITLSGGTISYTNTRNSNMSVEERALRAVVQAFQSGRNSTFMRLRWGQTYAEEIWRAGLTCEQGDGINYTYTRDGPSGYYHYVVTGLQLPAAPCSWSGTISSEWGLLSHLIHFDVSRGAASGSLPASFGQHWPNLEYFSIANNAVAGSIPESYGQWTRLRYFNASLNRLTGSLPASIGNWTNLEYFDVEGNLLTGALPASMERWTNLKVKKTAFKSFTS